MSLGFKKVKSRINKFKRNKELNMTTAYFLNYYLLQTKASSKIVERFIFF